jgi:hypothetical protein
MTTLQAWEPHPVHAHREVRSTWDNVIVLSLFPEGDDDSVCWVWELQPDDRPPTEDFPHGHSNDKETARKQADLAAIGYGYHLLPQANPR